MKKNKNTNRVLITAVCVMLAFLCSVGSAFAASEKSTGKTLTVAVPSDRCPIFYPDEDSGEPVGIGVDLMRAAAENAGLSVRFRFMSEPTLKDALDNPKYDLVMPFGSAIPSTSGKETVVSENLFQTPFTLITVADRKVPSLDNIRVGMLASQAGVSETISGLYPGITITLYETMDDSVSALRKGEVDALLNNTYVWSYVLQKPSYSKQLSVQPTSMFTMDFRAGAQDSEKSRALIKRLNTGIAKIDDAKRQAIILDYTSRKLYHYVFSDYLNDYGGLLLIFLLILFLTGLGNYRLAKANKAAEEASKAKGMFLANMSHEIRTPINSIMGMGELISRETKDPKIQQYVYSMNSSANSLLALVNDILDFSRIEAGKLKLRREPYHLSNLLTDVDMMIRSRAESKHLTYEVEVNPDIPNELIGDEARLKQVIINLLTNGVKYTIAGYVRLIVDFDKAGKDSVDLKVTVRDSGMGMKKEEIEKLFKAFERLDEDKNRTIEGTGLGMSIVKQILDAMDSRLSVKSVYGSGSDFSFVVRQKVSDRAPIGDYETSARQVVSEMDGYCPSFVAPSAKILAVDDTELNLKVLTGLLEQTKMQVDTALSGKVALELLKDTRYDILLIDHRMPEMDGVELLKHIRSNTENPNHESVCIVLTANVVEGIRDMFMEAGFAEYLEKPVNGLRLEETLKKYLPAEKIVKADPDAETESENNAGRQQKHLIPHEIFDELLRLQNEGLIHIEDGIEYAGTEALFLKTLEFFRDSVEKKADEIEQFYQNENTDDYTVKVHALKSSARIIGAYDLSEKARLLEMAGRDNDWDYIRENTDAVLKDYRRYRDALSHI